MKNIVVMMLMALLLIWSCEKESTKPEEHELVGTWNAQTETHYWGSISNPDSTDVTTYQSGLATWTWKFESDDKFNYNMTLLGQDFLSGDGTWSTSGDQLTLNFTVFGIETQEIYTYEIEGDELTVTQELDPAEDEGDWAIIVFSKQ